MDVVSTFAGTCTVNIGSRHLALVISAASGRAWNSADCAGGPVNRVADLRRGVPTVVIRSWDGQSSSRGCPAEPAHGPVAQPRSGRYSATAVDGALTSNTKTFEVR